MSRTLTNDVGVLVVVFTALTGRFKCSIVPCSVSFSHRGYARSVEASRTFVIDTGEYINIICYMFNRPIAFFNKFKNHVIY